MILQKKILVLFLVLGICFSWSDLSLANQEKITKKEDSSTEVQDPIVAINTAENSVVAKSTVVEEKKVELQPVEPEPSKPKRKSSRKKKNSDQMSQEQKNAAQSENIKSIESNDQIGPKSDPNSLENKVLNHVLTGEGFPVKSTFIEEADQADQVKEVSPKKESVIQKNQTVEKDKKNSVKKNLVEAKSVETTQIEKPLVQDLKKDAPDNTIHEGIALESDEDQSVSPKKESEEVKLSEKVNSSFPISSDSHSEKYEKNNAGDEAFSPSKIFWAFSLLIFIMLALAAAWYFLQKKSWKMSGVRGSMRIVMQQNIGPKAQVVVIEVYGQKFLIGVTPENVSTLAELDSDLDKKTEDQKIKNEAPIFLNPALKVLDERVEKHGFDQFDSILSSLNTSPSQDENEKKVEASIPSMQTTTLEGRYQEIEFKPGFQVLVPESDQKNKTTLVSEGNSSAMDKLRGRMKGMKKITATH